MQISAGTLPANLAAYFPKQIVVSFSNNQLNGMPSTLPDPIMSAGCLLSTVGATDNEGDWGKQARCLLSTAL